MILYRNALFSCLGVVRLFKRRQNDQEQLGADKVAIDGPRFISVPEAQQFIQATYT